uniref:Dolichyl-diphosphooligosaccharide--protein glycosyltransferase 48 kDa subunit n=1 Tax=Strongyloides venezuelensis TaxID=75913 RepID=A0A0K0G297_STRVS
MKFLLFLLVSFIIQLNANKILVLIDDVAIRETHSEFLDSLKARGHRLSIRFADDSTLSLFKFGKRIYDDVFILAPSVHKFGGAINAGQINNFVDDGGNLLVTGSSNIGDAIREIAIEFGFEYDLAKTSVVDHFNYDSILDDGHHTTIVVNKEQMTKSKLITGDIDKNGPLLFKGVGLLAHKENNLVLEIVNGYSTSFSYNPSSKTGKPSIAGKDLVLVGGVQSRNNARAVFTGSLEMFSNDYFTSSAQSASGGKGQISGNKNFVIELSKWILQENGVLRVASVKHNVVGESEAPEMYTIMDDIEYKIKIEEKKEGKWVPFTPSDLQLEFVRVDPFIRKTLTKKGDVLWTKFKCPNVNGIYKFKVDYHRKGYSHLTNIITVPVRPFTHTQYERFIRTAYPYYAGAFSMMGGFVIFCIFFLYSKETAPVTVEKKTN